ncbi:MAG: DUF3990 domain-containing protein [Turicibacter sp.]|nr:DUF3990 domain-containing protein [Turicibacter sp.]
MRAYHGSNVKIMAPNISFGRAMLDFGAGFYVTTSFEQAKNWAKRQAVRLSEGVPIVNYYS